MTDPHTDARKLRGCPFCGEAPDRVSATQDETSYAGHDIVWHASVSCANGCANMSEEHPELGVAESMVIVRWNTRRRLRSHDRAENWK